MHNLWVPAMVLALENLSFSKVSSMLHSLVHGGSYMIVALKLYKLWCHIKYKCDSASYDSCTEAVQVVVSHQVQM